MNEELSYRFFPLKMTIIDLSNEHYFVPWLGKATSRKQIYYQE